jgi:hypothetical protein
MVIPAQADAGKTGQIVREHETPLKHPDRAEMQSTRKNAGEGLASYAELDLQRRELSTKSRLCLAIQSS